MQSRLIASIQDVAIPMEPQDSSPDKPLLRLFDVIPEFFSLPPSQGYQGTQVRSDVVPVTPELASKLLLTQWANRKPSLVKVKEWKRRMLAGEWLPGQPIMFDADGFMIDGQHRLMAIESLQGCGIQVPMTIIQGIPKESQGVIDIGCNRRMADILSLKGVDIGINGISLAKAMFLPFAKSGASQSKLTSPTYMEKVVVLHREGIAEASMKYGKNHGNFAPVRAMVALAWKHENHDSLRRFLEVWDTRRSRTESEDAISILRDAYDARGKADSGSSFRRDFAMKACRVIKAHLKGEVLKQVRSISNCPWPHPLPEEAIN